MLATFRCARISPLGVAPVLVISVVIMNRSPSNVLISAGSATTFTFTGAAASRASQGRRDGHKADHEQLPHPAVTPRVSRTSRGPAKTSAPPATSAVSSGVISRARSWVQLWPSTRIEEMYASPEATGLARSATKNRP